MTQKTRVCRAHVPGSVRLAALVLTALTLCAFLAVRPVRAAEWMTPYLEQVQEWGVMKGDSQGNLHEDRNITRAEFVTLVNRAFGYEEPSPSNPFSDVNPNDWFAEDISIAHQAGYFNGTSANTASPYALVTREQAAVLLGRCLRFQGVPNAANSSFTDMQDIGGWSRSLVQEAAELGIIQGYADGSFRPRQPITRGQMACFLVRALGTLVQEPGEQTSGGVYGNLTITTPGVKLKDTVVTGNLYLTGGVGLGNVELENVTVQGKIVICGGGEAEAGKQSVLLRNVTAEALELDSLSEQFLSVQAEGLTNINEVTVRTPGYLEDRTEDGLGLQTIRLDGIENSLFQLAGNIKRVVNLTPGSTLQLAQGVADVITMDEKALDAKLTIDDRASIRELNLDLATQVDGKGSISHLNINAPGSKVTMLPDTIYIRPGITGNVYNQNMDNIAAAESSEDPRLLAGYPKVKDIAPTSATAAFSTNKAGTIHWAVTALMDGSLGEEELMNPGSNAKILRSGTLRATASNTEVTARLTGLTREGSYYVSALLEDARGRRSPVKIAAFTTPDDSAPNFVNGYPQTPILTTDADGEQVAQVMVMATKDCQMYYALFPRGSTAPTAADFRSASLRGNLGNGVVTLRKNTPFLLSRINTSHLQEKTQYDLYLWLNDADNGKSSAVRRVQFTTKDITAPTIVDLHVVSNAARSVTLSFTLDEPGTLNWAVTKKGENFGVNTEKPTVQDQIHIEGVLVGGRVIRKGGPVRAAREQTAYSFTVSGLEAQTSYDLFYTAKDTAGNYCVYNKSIDFPLPIKTLDNDGPEAELDYSDYTQDAKGVKRPWAESDVSIVFSEEVQGIGNQNQQLPDVFLAQYQKVTGSSGDAKVQAKRDLATMLQTYISFHTGTPPANANSRPSAESKVAVKADQSNEALELLPAWIDYREAVVEVVNAKTIIRFPGDGTALKLQSGQSYYFMLQNIEDTSNNPMDSPTYLGFSTAFATVILHENQADEQITYNGDTKDAYIFYLDPQGTPAVPDNTRWDMLIWTDANMEYDLYVKIHDSSAPPWFHLGTINPNLGRSGKVYNSLNGNFNTNTVSKLSDSGLFGDFKTGEERPKLNGLLQQLEFAVVPVNGTVTRKVTLEVQIFAGENRAIGNIARSQGTSAILGGQNVTAIGDPDMFKIEIDPPDEAPTLVIPYQGIEIGDESVTVHVTMRPNGTVHYFLVPLDNVSMDSNNNPIGTGYTMSEFTTNPPKVNGATPALQDIPTTWEQGYSPTDSRMFMDVKAPNTTLIAQHEPDSLDTFMGDSGDQLLNSNAADLNISGLTPNKTYLLYLVTQDQYDKIADQALCYRITTTPPTPPKVQALSRGNNRAEITVDKASNVYYILVRSQQLRNGAFAVPFTTGSSLVDSTKGALPQNYLDRSSQTVLDAMLTPVQNNAGEFQGTVFDLYATRQAKSDYFDIISDPNNEFSDELPVMREPGTLVRSTTGSFNLTGMQGSNRYTLIVAARSQNSTSTSSVGFSAAREFYNSTSAFLYVQSAYAGDNANDTNPASPTSPTFNGSIFINFSNALYFLPPEDSTGDPYPVDSCAAANGPHAQGTGRDYNLADGYVSFGSIVTLGPFSLQSPTSNTHKTSIGNQLEFKTTQNVIDGATITFRAPPNAGGLCDSKGSIRQNNRTLTATLRRTASTDANGLTTYSWSVEITPAWRDATTN